MEELDQVAAARLRAHGQRYTANRRRLMEVLGRARSPLTIPEILQDRPDLAQSSVYRNLMLLEQSGLVQRIVTNDDWARFELAEDLTEHHHHLICSSCGLVRDFTVPPQVERSVANAFATIADETGFHLQHHRLDLVGVCPACAA